MKKIVYLTDQMYLHGGAERVLTNKANYFIKHNLAEIYIITTEQQNKKPCYDINSNVKFIDLEINYDRNKSYFHPKNVLKLPKHFLNLKKELNKIKPDNIVTLSLQFDYYFLPFILKGIQKIKEFHSSRYFRSIERKKNKSFFKKQFYKFNDYIESKYDSLVLLTIDEKQHFKSDNIAIIPNAISHYPSKQSNLNNNKAISAGRIAPVKQFDKLIEAWSYVAKSIPDWKLEIYGEGSKQDLDELQKKINKLNLSEIIFLRGQTNDLESKMLEASLYVMSSKTECFPMVLLEAMSCGLPVISFNCPYGPKNIITDTKDGFLTPADDIKGLGSKIIEVIHNKKELEILSINARMKAKLFLPETVMQKWLKLFNIKNITK
ncbi:glycosyltransferase family 4 protein [Cellulophaga sp. 20_2_10]|uniref:glycosyltransferase family 4 protein n=1 Tax=Cellulophaga sp. 20_2_10 TaxID=2942476 RepID=UPI00201A891C|nr:glycosyltransferase family 4 protein [Cellulophaga sp. 20_2_10]MCL5244784.1 glycosyltransferase family 4 protein [Cellulophaga sp. 20_2_10]